MLSTVFNPCFGVLSGFLSAWNERGWIVKHQGNLKVYMTRKIFSAYLKGLSKYRRMAFFFSKYLFPFLRYCHFCIMQIR